MGNGIKNSLSRILTTKSLLLFPCDKNKFFIPAECNQFQKLTAIFQRLLVAIVSMQ